ncbi:MAG TPA: co-chaperone GroES, partial [Micavibrio sp.]|nr:co-chaperone GroES [Micavibrio sp.]
MKFRPLHDRVLIRRLEQDAKTAGGIIIPDSAQEKPMEGEVIAIGNGKRLDDGTIQKPDLQVGDSILFSKYAGSEVTIEGEE